MTNESIRIRTIPGQSQNIRFKIDQDFDFLEVLSLKISQEDLYQSFCANYGVVIGRIIANKGFGVPNAKLSIFVPISDEDQKNQLIKDLYPFKTPYQKDKNGIRYNLLLSKQTCILNKPIGTFPSKEDMLDNEIILEVFDKYYKYTTKTNEAGDFMIFGVPTGQQVLHMDLDMSDIGAASVRPYDLISEGYPEKLFASKTEFKSSTNLDSLPQVKSGNKGVEVIPFWGDSETCEIGITRADFDTGLEIKPTALFFGSIFTDDGKMALNRGCNPKNDQGEQDRLKTGAGRIDMIRAKDYNQSQWVNSKQITPTELEEFSIDGGELIDDDGVFAFPLPMNLGHVITDEYGDLIPSPDPSIGIATKGMYRFKMNFTQPNENPKFRTAHMLFPSLGRDFGGTYGAVNIGSSGGIQGGTEDQRFSDDINDYRNPELDFHLFEWKQLYSIAHYIKKYKKGGNRFSFLGIKNTDVSGETNLFPFTNAIWHFDMLYYIVAFFIDIIAFIIKLVIILISFCINFCFRLSVHINFSFSIPKKCIGGWGGTIAGVNWGVPTICFPPNTINFNFQLVNFDLNICFSICPFSFLANVFPDLPAPYTGKGFFLACDGGGPNGEGYPIDLTTGCNTISNTPFCTCQGIGCVGTNCGYSNTWGNNVLGGSGPYLGVTGANPNTNNCLNVLDDWKCCVKLNLAESRNVIRRNFNDAWVFGTAYLFQFKYKKNKRGKEKFCGPGADTVRGDNYKRNDCCLESDSNGNGCHRCLVRGPGKSRFHNYTGIYNYQYPDHNNAITGANDINDMIYCNALMSTKIVSLGRVEMCSEELDQIEDTISANKALRQYTQNLSFFTGTFFENGWDSGYWAELLKESSYEDPREVLLYLGSQTTPKCDYRLMFYGGGGCHEYELKDSEFFFMKEVSKIYNDIALSIDSIGTPTFNPISVANPLADPNALDSQVVPPDGPFTSADGGFEVVTDVGDRFSPCGSSGICPPFINWSPTMPPPYDELSANNTMFDGLTAPSIRNNINTRSNIPYYYFGINPGKTAINKLRKDFFVVK